MNLKSQLYASQFKSRQWLLSQYHAFRATARTEVDLGSFRPERILFVLAGLIGDSVMSFPVVAEARRIWPNARITVLGKTHNRELLAASPEIDEFYVCDADPLSLRRSDEVKKLQRWLSAQDFDIAIILLGDQYAHLLAKANVPIRVGVAGTLMKACLTHTYAIGRPESWGPNERLNALRTLGLAVEKRQPRLSISEFAVETSISKLRQYDLSDDESYIVIHPFASTELKWWNLAKIGPLAKKIHDELGMHSFLVGGPGVKDQVGNFDIAPAINLCGKFTLSELVSVIDKASAVVTTDSGPFHIAGALRKPTVGLFRRRCPFHASNYEVVKPVFGETDVCMIDCDFYSCKANPCRQMAEINEDRVFEALVQTL